MAKHPRRTAVCLFVRDEERDLTEWLAYQFAVGFKTVFVYDNGSTDSTPDICWQFMRKYYSVRHMEWPDTSENAQIAAYEDCLARAGSEFDWIAFIDADELIVPKTGDINTLLAPHTKADAIVINWAMFGSCGHVKRPPGTMIETFRRRAPSNVGRSIIIKYVVRPDKVTHAMSPCAFKVKGQILTPAGRVPRWKNEWVSTSPPEHSVAQINHYFTRSREDWQRKLARGYRDDANYAETLRSSFAKYDTNDIEDRGAFRFLPEMRKTFEWLEAT